LQEETTALAVPCITLRENTERPITIEVGTNILAGTRKDTIIRAYRKSLEVKERRYSVPPKWDGKASQRIWDIILGT
jgi:UDP-N-acetylglucosamine 2-epimerase (non-hydrolysing)